jgi:hypothetical protein
VILFFFFYSFFLKKGFEIFLEYNLPSADDFFSLLLIFVLPITFAMATLRQKWAIHRTYRRIQNCWQEYLTVSDKE